MFKSKGQGSLEYLLLIGGAVLVAAIVIALIVSSSSSGSDVTKCNSARALCASKYFDSTACNGTSGGANASVTIQGTKYSCQWLSNSCKATLCSAAATCATTAC